MTKSGLDRGNRDRAWALRGCDTKNTALQPRASASSAGHITLSDDGVVFGYTPASSSHIAIRFSPVIAAHIGQSHRIFDAMTRTGCGNWKSGSGTQENSHRNCNNLER